MLHPADEGQKPENGCPGFAPFFWNCNHDISNNVTKILCDCVLEIGHMSGKSILSYECLEFFRAHNYNQFSDHITRVLK